MSWHYWALAGFMVGFYLLAYFREKVRLTNQLKYQSFKNGVEWTLGHIDAGTDGELLGADIYAELHRFPNLFKQGFLWAWNYHLKNRLADSSVIRNAMPRDMKEVKAAMVKNGN